MTAVTYLQASFWKKLMEDKSREGIRSLVDVSDALLNSVVITDLSYDVLLQDSFLQVLLLNEQQPTPCDENYIDKKLSQLDNNSNAADLSATYMIDKTSDKCASIENDYGVLAVCVQSLPNRRKLFKGDGFSLDKNRKYPRRYMTFQDKLSNPCNAAIIIDPYLLIEKIVNKDDGSSVVPGIEKNLASLLSAVLPDKLEVDFHLTIVSSLDNPEDIKRLHEKVKKCLKRIKKDLVVKLGVVYTSVGYRHNIESFHSRHLISNTFSMSAEDGLDLFDENAYLTKNNPSVSIVFPTLFGNSRQDMTISSNWIKSVKNHIESSDRFIYGEKSNRLFELV